MGKGEKRGKVEKSGKRCGKRGEWEKVELCDGHLGKSEAAQVDSGKGKGSAVTLLRCCKEKVRDGKKTWLRASVDSGYPYFSFLLHKLTTKKCKYAGIQIKDPYVVLLCCKVKVRDGKN